MFKGNTVSSTEAEKPASEVVKSLLSEVGEVKSFTAALGRIRGQLIAANLDYQALAASINKIEGISEFQVTPFSHPWPDAYNFQGKIDQS